MITLSGATQEQFSSFQSGQKRTGGRGYGRGHGLDDCGVLSFSRPTPFDQTTSFASSGPPSTAGLSCSSSNGFTESARHLMSMPIRAHTHTTRQPRTPNRKNKANRSTHTHMPPACTCDRTGAHAKARASALSSRTSTKRCSCLWSNACGHSSNPKGQFMQHA